MTDWKKTTLGQVAQVFTGFPFKSNDYSEDPHDIKLLRGDNIAQGTLRWDDAKKWPKSEYEKYAQYQLKEDDVVLAMDRPWIGAGLKYSSVRKEDLPSLLVQRTARLRGSAELDIIYLKYIIASPWFSKYIQSINTGSLVPHISSKQIKDFPVNLPSVQQQKRLSSVLAAIDNKIDINNRINAELEAMAKTLYDYWFVQFDFPDTTGKPYKTSGGKMVYNATLRQEIPAGWSVDTLSGWIADDKTGDWGKENREGNYTIQVNCIRGADINGLNGYGNTSMPVRYILGKNEKKLLSVYDFVIEISGGSPTQSTGRMAFITKEMLDRFTHPVICSNFCKAITLRDNLYFYNFAYMWNDIYNKGVLFGWEGKTSGIKNLLFDSFVDKHHVCVPNKDLVKVFHDVMMPLHQKKQKNLKKNAELEKLRDWLLPLLMNGQVTVK